MAGRFIILFILPYFLASATAATSPIIHLNSTNQSSWLNQNSIDLNVNTTDGSKVRAILSRTKSSFGFIAGFYCPGNSTSYYFSIIVVGGGNATMVWSAKPDNPVGDYPVGENSNLTLTRDAGLVLRDSNGFIVWSTKTSGMAIAGMNVTELGNLVLFNETGAVVWQSFDHPTDTLLAGQRLYEDQKLFSGSSQTNWSEGLYYATLKTGSGLAAFTQVDKGEPQMYYNLASEQDSTDNSNSWKGRCRLVTRNEVNDTSDYAELQTGRFLVNLGTSREPFGSNSSKLPLDSSIEYVKIDSDGSLKLYRHEPETGTREILDMVTKDLGICQHPRQCGEFGICNEGKCSCPKGVDGLKESNGRCTRTKPLSCQANLQKLENVSYFNFIDSSSVSSIKDIESCKQACLQNCACGAAFFRYDTYNDTYNDSNGYCYIASEVLSIRQGEIPNHNFTSTAYIKVEIPRKKLIARIAGSVSAVLVVFVLSGLVSAVLVVFVLSVAKFWVKFRNTSTKHGEDYMGQVPGMPVRFSNEELHAATRGFKERLGSGGFGLVFKGVLPDGTEIAVKRLYKMGHAVREFLAEVETIGSIHHFNLVRLVGFSAEKSCLLVYEYMRNGSLDNWIFYRDEKPSLDWETRKKIILQIAKGLAYLHEECRQRIIHLDIKPQNILLDENFDAKISDFGLSKLVDRNESQVLITLRGTPGYIAPECGHSKITTKVDIYSFGIVLLEIVTGRRNLDGTRSESSKHLLSLMQKKAEEDRLIDIVEKLEEETHQHQEEMLRMIRIAAWCLQNDHTRRPLMSTVVKVLEGVMEVDPNISYKFTHAMGSAASVGNSRHVYTAQQASVLSNPR